MFVIESHKSLHSEKTDSEVLAVRNDMTTKDIVVNAGAGNILLLKILNHGIINDVLGLFDGFVIETLRGTNNNICQTELGKE